MKIFYYLLAILVALSTISTASAQQDKPLTEREAIRKERNQIEFTGSMMGSLTALSDSWIETSGGDNSISLLATLYFRHTFTKNDFKLQTLFTSKFGYYRMAVETVENGVTSSNQSWYKNQDEFYLEVTPSYKMTKNWSYGASVKFRSQYTEGYVSNGSQDDYHLKSTFMSPGYLDTSVGFIYNCPKPKFPVTVSLNPIAMSAVYVRNEEVKLNAQYGYESHVGATPTYATVYGVNPDKNSLYEGGSSVQIDFKKTFGKKQYLTYTTSLYSFYGWMTQVAHDNTYGDIHEYEAAQAAWDGTGDEPMLNLHPSVRWENQIDIKATKFLTTTLNFQLYYNRAQNYDIQTQTLLSVGLSYKFDSKAKKEKK